MVPHLPKYVDVKWKFNELTNTGVTGDPTKGTPEKGRKMPEAMVEAVVKIISDLDATDWDWRHYTKTSIWRAVTVSGIPFSTSLSVLP